jgi:hypothetical protein
MRWTLLGQNIMGDVDTIGYSDEAVDSHHVHTYYIWLTNVCVCPKIMKDCHIDAVTAAAC